ncbi:ABC transporter ATP-binding protein [Algicola sagamiensis]|uniref:ABC transporter ATP-binding protein n=1 Tax=Algicola sagamiensis TaxID=163869 RepID=UPI0003821759|nr:ABC transporter ATP-binding protein [Algicola sagamiensis]
MLQLQKMSLIRGHHHLLRQVDLTVFPGHKVGVVGPNGCGKSSLFALIRNELQADEGEVSFPTHWQIASVRQETPALNKPAIEYVIDGDEEYRSLQNQLVQAESDNAGEKIASLHHQLDTIQGYSIHARAGALLHGLGFSTAQLQQPVSDFSGGWRMRLNLAQALICRSDLLLLDEPTNHLDLDAVIWLEQWLKQYQGTLLLISHDRDFLDSICGEIMHFHQNSIDLYSGNYSSFERQRGEKLAQQQAAYEKQQVQKAHLQSFVDRFRAKASKAKQAQSRLKALAKMEEIMPAHVTSEFNFSFQPPERLPNPLVHMENVSAGYGEKVILQSIKMNLVPGSRIGLLGRNGAGKSTFIKLLSGELAPMNGIYEPNAGLHIGYFAQHQLETLRPDESPLAHMTRLDPSVTEQEHRNFLGGFAFSGDKALTPVGTFSGGEKARLVLAILVYQKPNLLLLDEPTNHLDLEMRQALTIALQSFEGALIVVSHDRHLLSATTDEFYLVDQGLIAPFQGDLSDYQKWLMQSNSSASETQDTAQASPSANRKEIKRLEAEHRKKLSPFKKSLEKVEKQIEKGTEQLNKLEEQLADNSLYTEENKTQLKDLLKQQSDLKNELGNLEEEWLGLQESIEALQQEFDACRGDA